jgi:hypothetical protein
MGRCLRELLPDGVNGTIRWECLSLSLNFAHGEASASEWHGMIWGREGGLRSGLRTHTLPALQHGQCRARRELHLTVDVTRDLKPVDF